MGKRCSVRLEYFYKLLFGLPSARQQTLPKIKEIVRIYFDMSNINSKSLGRKTFTYLRISDFYYLLKSNDAK